MLDSASTFPHQPKLLKFAMTAWGHNGVKLQYEAVRLMWDIVLAAAQNPESEDLTFQMILSNDFCKNY